MFETSLDLLYVVLAFCALWLTIFISWLLYYVIMILRDATALVHQAKAAVERVERFASFVHEKAERSAASFTLVASALKEVITWAIQERAKKKGRARKLADE